MEFFYFVDGIKEDKYLRVFFSFRVEFFEDGADDVFMHFCFIFYNFIVIFDSLQGDNLFS